MQKEKTLSKMEIHPHKLAQQKCDYQKKKKNSQKTAIGKSSIVFHGRNSNRSVEQTV